MASSTSGNGIQTSFTKTPQAADDSFGFTENDLQAGSFIQTIDGYADAVTLDVMANDLGGNAKTLYSIDDGDANFLNDLLTSNISTGWEQTHAGNWMRIFNGKIQISLTTSVTNLVGSDNFNALTGSMKITDSFNYAVRPANGTLSWATVSLTINGSNDAATIGGSGKGIVVEDVIPAVLTVDSSVTWSDAATCDSRCSP